MKKLIALVLVAMLAVIGLTACSNKTTTTVQATEAPAATETATEAPATETPTAEAPATGETTVVEENAAQ